MANRRQTGAFRDYRGVRRDSQAIFVEIAEVADLSDSPSKVSNRQDGRLKPCARTLAQAELALVQAALADGALAAARRWATAARQRFHRQGNGACAYLADLTLLRARVRH